VNWERLNLASPEFATPPEPPAFSGLIYAGKRHLLIGEPETYKTTISWIFALDVMRNHGLIVAAIDFESGPAGTRRLLDDLGATNDELRSIYYVEPDQPPDADDIVAIQAANVGLVILDATAGAFCSSGLDDNKRVDAERFSTTWIEPFWRQKIATIAIDHVPKNSDGRGRFAIGSERKVGAVDVVLSLEAIKAMTRGGDGLVRATVFKDRPGFLLRPTAAEIELTSDPETHAITWAFNAPTSMASTSGSFEPTDLMAHARAFLARQTEPVPFYRVEEAIPGRRKWRRIAINKLIENGEVTETKGPRKARLLQLKSTSPHLAPTSPGEPTNDLAHLAHPLLGGKVAGQVNNHPNTPTSPRRTPDVSGTVEPTLDQALHDPDLLDLYVAPYATVEPHP
jgi:hypothetical protein